MMRLRTIKFLLFLLCLPVGHGVYGQVVDVPENITAGSADTANLPGHAIKHIKGAPVSIAPGNGKISMTRDEALTFLEGVSSSRSIWKKSNDPLRQALRNLVFFAKELPEDSTISYLSAYEYDRLRVPLESFYTCDSIRIILPVMMPDSSVAGDSAKPLQAGEMFVEAGERLTKVKLDSEAVPLLRNDTLKLNDSVFVLIEDFVPSLLPQITNDTIILVITDTLPEVTLYRDDFPFRRLRSPYVTDSIKAAVNSLTEYLMTRDSTMVKLVGETGRGTELWLNSRANNLVRFWLPDGETDSVSVWVGSPARNTLSLKAEEGVMFRKQIWHDSYVDTRVDVITVREENLRKVQLSKIKPDYWKFKTDFSYLLSQGSFSNWAKGGNNNISTLLDVTSALNYNNKDTKVNSSTTARFSLGIQASGKDAMIKKNADILEINSKLNHKAFGKFDLSGLFQFKTQFLPGYNYPNDSVKVSKFFNPATFIFGYGLEYKPDKNTSISFSPISYKCTFVPDTSINQTKFGIPADKRSKNELGAYLTINSKMELFERVSMTNRIQLFSNFLSDPQNVDVDWEMIATTSLNWFTDLRLNIHLIYDDDTLLPVYENGEPVLDFDGVQKKAPMVQFKELLGVSFVFKF
jgi:hypothetical protein